MELWNGIWFHSEPADVLHNMGRVTSDDGVDFHNVLGGVLVHASMHVKN